MEFGFKTEGNAVVKHFADQVRGRTFLLTGPSPGGLGAETLYTLARGGPAQLILIGRSETKCAPVVSAIHSIDASIKITFIEADLANLSSVRAAASRLLSDASIPKIDVVINNAAIMFGPFQKTVDGIEMQLACGYLGHFVLTNTLMPKIRAAGPGARIVNVSSSGVKLGPVRFEDPNFEKGEYNTLDAYGQAKRASALYTVALNTRFARSPTRDFPHAFTLNPGYISTHLQVNMDQELMDEGVQRMFGGDYSLFMGEKTLQQGCATALRAALDPGLVAEGREGDQRWGERVFLEDCRLVTPETYACLVPEALDKGDAERLWGVSEGLVGEKFDI